MKGQYYVKSQKTNLTIDEIGITISRKGMINTINHGLKGEKTIPYSSITATQIKKPGFTTGYLQLSIAGGKESTGGLQDALKDENTILFKTKKEHEVMIQLKEYIDAKILNRNTPQPQVQNIVQEKSAAEQVKEMKELLDMGILTEEEFDQKKRELLNL